MSSKNLVLTRSVRSALSAVLLLGVCTGIYAEEKAVLEEVVVSARRREENIQQIPVSITALSQQTLDENHLQSLTDLQYFVPSLTLNQGLRDEQFPAIRGQGGFNPNSTSAVISYLNEVPLPTGQNGGLLGSQGLYFDLENVAVLKGPQGTLFGKNTTGGVVLLQSKRPTDRFEGHVEVTGGNHRDREVDAVLNVPVVEDKLLVRLAINGAKRDGFTKVLSTPSHPNGLDLDNVNFSAGRVTVTFKPTEALRNDLIYTGFSSHNNGSSGILDIVPPSAADPDQFGFPGLIDALAQQRALGIRKQIPTDVDQYSNIDLTSITDILSYSFSNDLTLRNIMGYIKAETSAATESDGSIFPVLDSPISQEAPTRTKQYTEELQLQGRSLGGKLTWVTGGFFSDSPKPPELSRNTSLFFGFPSVAGGRGAQRSKAIYAQGTYDLSSWVSGLKFTAGGRFTWDHQYAQTRNGGLDETGACIAPPAGADSDCRVTSSGDFKAPTWTLGFDYQMRPDTLVYLASRRGYRTGGFNAGFLPAADIPFGPEYVTDQELGVKTDWAVGNVTGRTNAAVYHQDYTKAQLFTCCTLDLGGNVVGLVKNAGKADVWGAELEQSVNISRNLDLTANFSWLNFKYTHLDPGVNPVAVQQNRMVDRPKYKYGVGGRYRLPVDSNLGDISATANWSWMDDNGSTSDPDFLIKAYGLLTLGAAWDRIVGSPIDASFFMTNAANKVWHASAAANSAVGFTSTLQYGEPRMWGIRLRYRFGAEM